MKRSGPPPRRTSLTAKTGLPPAMTPLPQGKPLQRSTPMPRGEQMARRGPGPRAEPRPAPRRQPSKHPDTPETVKRTVRARDKDLCVCCGHPAPKGEREHQHRRPRGMGGRADAHRVSALILFRRICHRYWETEARDEGRRRGYFVKDPTDPATVPVLYWDGQRYLLNDHGDRIAVNHHHEGTDDDH